MLCYVMLCYVMLCYVMLCYVMLCYVMLCYVMLCYVILYYIMLCHFKFLFYVMPDSHTITLDNIVAILTNFTYSNVWCDMIPNLYKNLL